MNLLIDSVMVNSPGAFQLRDCLAKAAAQQAPKGCKVILLVPSESSCGLTESEVIKIVCVDKPKSYWWGKWNWYNRLLPRIAKDYDADVVYSLSGLVSGSLCKMFGVVTTANNMTPFTPEIMHASGRFSKNRFFYTLMRVAITRSIKAADTVVLHSEHALKMIQRYTGDISKKTFVVLTGIPFDVQSSSLTTPSHPYSGKPYFLYLSAIYPYKNHIRLIEAYRRAFCEDRHLPDLLIAGLPTNKDCLKDILETINNTGISDKIKYIGAVDRKDIPAWIRHAEVNFFPSLCETNSIVLAEIIGLGAALSCSNITPMSEVASYAAEYFDPHSVDSIKSVIIALSKNPQRLQELRSLSTERASDLSWSKCGDAIWQAAIKAQNLHSQRTKRKAF